MQQDPKWGRSNYYIFKVEFKLELMGREEQGPW